jgi:hypothetical protein
MIQTYLMHDQTMNDPADRAQITRSCAPGSSIGGIDATAPNGGSAHVLPDLLHHSA